jgi:hypothetical protein
MQRCCEKDETMAMASLPKIILLEATKVRDEHSTVYDERIHWNALIGYDDNDELYKYIYFASGKEQLFC